MPPAPDTTTLGTRPGPWRAVAQRLVHKVAAGEVLVTDLAPVTPGLVAVATRWPAGHRRHDRRAGTVGHLLLVVETIRQAGLCVAHAHLGVPLAARAGAPLVGLDVAFDRFAELDRPTRVRTRSVRHADGPAVDVRHGQGEETVARASVLVMDGGDAALRPATSAAAAAGPAPRNRPAAPAGPGGR